MPFIYFSRITHSPLFLELKDDDLFAIFAIFANFLAVTYGIRNRSRTVRVLLHDLGSEILAGYMIALLELWTATRTYGSPLPKTSEINPDTKVVMGIRSWIEPEKTLHHCRPGCA